jgi:hypothetical protein
MLQPARIGTLAMKPALVALSLILAILTAGIAVSIYSASQIIASEHVVARR